MRYVLFFFFLFSFSILLSQEKEVSFSQKEITKNIVTHTDELIDNDDEILVRELKGLYFSSSEKKGDKEIYGIVIDDLYVPSPTFFVKKMEPFLFHPITWNGLQEIKKEVINFYRDNNFPVVHVAIPAGQDITDGEVHFVVTIGKLGEVKAEGGEYFSDERTAKIIRTKEGEMIESSRMKQDLNWINNNPFRSASMVYEAGKKAGETDVTLYVNDRFPFRVYTGYENNEYNIGGESRCIVGCNWGKVFRFDQLGNYQFMSAPNPKKWRNHSFSYIIPLPWRHTFKTFGGFSRTKPTPNPNIDETEPIGQSDFDLNGKGWQLCGRYDVPLTMGNQKNIFTFSGGYDFKRTNNFVLFDKRLIYTRKIEISQFIFHGDGTLEDRRGMTSFAMDIFFSPGKMTPHNRDRFFRQERAGATARYYYGTLNLERVTRLFYDCSWYIKGLVQATSTKLLPSEELSLGGQYTVRGYKEHEVISDRGALLKNELRTMTFPFFSGMFSSLKKYRDKEKMQFLAFLDFGWANDIDQNILSKYDTFLLSIGPGVRYSWGMYVNFRFDYGWQLKDINRLYDEKNSHSRMHLSAIMGF